MRWIALLALLLPAVAAGCGGGSAQTTTQVTGQRSAGAPTKAGYIELADAICRNHQSRQADLESQAGELGPLTSKEKARQVADLLREESANRRAEIGELGDLEPPTADAAEVNEIIELVRTEADVIDSWAAAYDDLDEGAIRRQQIRLGVTAGKVADRARAFGFRVCGQQ
ncbi:MAG TPA: hypothetical protein VI035_05810 [Solirubrobacterales bacterium]